MMHFTVLEENEYTEFLDRHPLRTFIQTVEMAKVNEKKGYESHFVGVKENNKIICATMMISHKARFNKKFFYAPRGFLIDFNDKKLLAFFTNELKKYIKNNDGYVLRIEPEILYKERDINGDIVEHGFNNEQIYQNLLDLGYKHGGFYIELDSTKQVRWAFAIDLENKTEEEIFEKMKPNTKNQLRRASKYNITTRELEYNELDTFKEMVESSGQRKNFTAKPLSYYQNMYKGFHEKGYIKYMIAELDVEKYKESILEELEMSKTKKENTTNSPANQGKINEFETNIATLYKRLEQANDIQKEAGNIVMLAGGMFMTYGTEIVYLFSGSRGEYLLFGGQYFIQWDMIKYGIKNGYKKYNFYGISGDFSEENKRHGLYEFKKSFGGTVIEYLGDFDLVVSKPIYLLHKIIRKLKKKKK